MGAGGACVVSWEGKGTGGIGSGLFGGVCCRGCSATLCFCLQFRFYCLDLVGENT